MRFSSEGVLQKVWTVLRSKTVLASTVGLLAGWVYFRYVLLWDLGFETHSLVERGVFIGFVFQIYPKVIVPFVIVATLPFRPAARGSAFKTALLIASFLLVPIPLVDYWRYWPGVIHVSPLSGDILLDLLVGLLYQGGLALFASVLAAWISPFLYRLLSGRLFRKGSA
jgi:hypothetical protein